MGRFSKSQKFDFIQAYEKVEDLWQDIPVVKKRKKRKKFRRTLKILGYSAAAAILILVIVGGAALMDLRDHYVHAIQGKKQLEKSLEQAEERNFFRAEILAEKAESNFEIVTERLGKLKDSPVLGLSESLRQQVSNYEDLSESALLLSTSLRRGTALGAEAQGIIGEEGIANFGQLEKQKKEELLRLLDESLFEIRGIKANLDLALWNLNRVDTDLPFFPFSQELERAKEELDQGKQDLEHFTKIISLFPLLAGYPDNSHFLVFFQNSDELRPTGGFLGTYGILETRSGDIERFDTHNVYHMDMPLEGEMVVDPPPPIKEYLNPNWYMRDANWSPDWPTSAQKLDWFYHKENQLLPPANRINDFDGEFDGIFAITPEFVSDLLEITGPITVEGKEYNKDNFQDLLQFQVEKGYEASNKSAWERKEVVGKILEDLKIRLFDLPVYHWGRAISSMEENLSQKNILLYFNNDHYQNLVEDLDWSGRIKESPQDYLMVVDSNMAALKTDSVMERGINYSLEQGLNGTFVDLRINYSHHGEPSWKISEYKSYTRILVPKGSELLEVNRNNLGPSPDKGIDTTQVQDKTSWGTFLTLEPGEVGSLNLKYKLPPKVEEEINEDNRYVLMLQKQPGVTLKESSIDISLLNDIKSYQPVGFYAALRNDNSVKWQSDITGDRKVIIDLEDE